MIELLQTLSVLVVAGYIVIVFQVYWLWQILKSRAWACLGLAWIIACALRFWSFVRLPFQLSEMQQRGYKVPPLSELLTLEAVAQIVAGFSVIILTIVGLHILRMSLEIRLPRGGRISE